MTYDLSSIEVNDCFARVFALGPVLFRGRPYLACDTSAACETEGAPLRNCIRKLPQVDLI